MQKKILIIDDDPGIRRSLALSLRTEGFAVVEAANGRIGLELASREAPNLIICDVNMPEMDGYAVVTKLRETSGLASVPFVFLTARGERAAMRRGMNLGADDYLTKPFTREELIETVKARLQKHEETRESLTEQLILAGERMRSRFFGRHTGQAAQAPLEDLPQPPGATRVVEATVLFTDIRGFTTISERLSVVEIATFLNHYFHRACEPIVAANGKVVKFIGDGIMAVFPHSEDEPAARQALRAVQAGLALSLVAHEFRDWMRAQFPDRGLPEFAIGVGIHTGEVTLCDVGTPGEHNFTALGDAVNIASRLEGQTKELGWPVVASGAAISAAGEAVVHGAHRVVHLRGRTKPVLVYQVLGLKGLNAPAPAANDLSTQLRHALASNAEGAALAVKAALRDTLLALLTESQTPSMSAPMRIKNYAVVSKLSQFDRSAVYLAEREADGSRVAIRIRQRRSDDEPAFRRFSEMATTVGRIEHPHVAAIYDHGFADDIAYIVTEYFPRGPIKRAFSLPLAPEKALAVIRQAAAGLAEVHARCTLSQDLHPDNIMVRANDDIALAELDCLSPGEAAAVHPEASADHAYRAPERLAGKPGDERSDIYSLGVIYFELLTGKLPRLGERMDGVLSRMLADNPAQRYGNAATLVQALD